MASSPSDGLRARVVVEAFERGRGWYAVEAWHLRDVVDGRVSPEALVTFLVLQSYGRRAESSWPGLARFARARLRPPAVVEADLLALEEAGWLVRTRLEGGELLTCTAERIRSGPAAPAPRIDAAPAPESPPAPAPPAPPKRPARRPKIQRPAQPSDVVALASELLEVYPHGKTDSGLERRPSRAEVEDLLALLVAGVKPDERERTFEEVRAGCKAFAGAPRSERDRRFVRGLEVWLRAHGWRDRPVVGKAPPPRDGEQPAHGFRASSIEEVRGTDGWAPVPTVDPAAAEAARAARRARKETPDGRPA